MRVQVTEAHRIETYLNRRLKKKNIIENFMSL